MIPMKRGSWRRRRSERRRGRRRRGTHSKHEAGCAGATARSYLYLVCVCVFCLSVPLVCLCTLRRLLRPSSMCSSRALCSPYCSNARHQSTAATSCLWVLAFVPYEGFNGSPLPSPSPLPPRDYLFTRDQWCTRKGREAGEPGAGSQLQLLGVRSGHKRVCITTPSRARYVCLLHSLSRALSGRSCFNDPPLVDSGAVSEVPAPGARQAPSPFPLIFRTPIC